MIPVAVGCGLIAEKVASLIQEKSDFSVALVSCLGGGSMWMILGSLGFSASPVLPRTILALTFAVTLTADIVFGYKKVP